MRIHAAQRKRLARLNASGADADDVPTVGELLDRSSGKPLSDDLPERWEARFTEKRVSF